MNRWKKNALVVVSGYLLTAIVNAEATATRSYRSIIDRNPFGLQEPIVHTNVVIDPSVNEQVKIYLTGITRLGKAKHVHLMIPPDGTNLSRYLSLAENDKDGVIEVLEINVEKETVRIRNAGFEANLNFLNDGLKTVFVAPTRRSSGPGTASPNESLDPPGATVQVPNPAIKSSAPPPPPSITPDRRRLPANVDDVR